MIILEKSLPINNIYVTCSEISNNIYSGMTLNIFDRYTNVETTLLLDVDTSNYPERINKYKVISPISGLTNSTYSFQVKNSTNIVCEEGMLQIVNSLLTPEQKLDSNYSYIPSTITDDDFIVYNQ